jgi:hypothetical protein
MTTKYKPTMQDLERSGGCEKLECDGFTKPQIFDALYKHTKGLDTDSRRDIVDKFYNRMETEKGYREMSEFKRRFR